MQEQQRPLSAAPRVSFVSLGCPKALVDSERIITRLRAEGLALLYISHRMHEIAELADDCTVFRNGRKIETYVAGSKTDEQVVEMMIGREYHHVFPPKPAPRPEQSRQYRCDG